MKEPYKNLHWHSRETIPHSYPLTDEEKLILGQERADAKAEIERLEVDFAGVKSRFKEEIDGFKGKLTKAATKFKSGLNDPVIIECDVYQDFENNEMVIVAVESGEELSRRPMTEREKYPTLFSVDEETRATIFPFNDR